MIPKVVQPENPLFTNGEHWNMNACVGDNGGPYTMFHYAEGFFEAGHVAVQSVEASTAKIDLLVYPIAFSYRHGIELMLKQLIHMLNLILADDGNPRKIHNMEGSWKEVQRLTDKIDDDLIEPEAVARVGELVGHFNDIDPTGQVFRYPEDVRNNRHLTEHKLINVEVLRDQMKEMQELLNRWDTQCWAFLDWQAEERAACGLPEGG